MKVVIVCLNQKFGAAASKELARNLGMTYSDCADEIETSLALSGAPLKDISIEWLERNERKTVKSCLKSDIVSIDYSTFSKYRPLITGDVIYLKLESGQVDKLFTSRFGLLDLRLCGLAKHVIKCSAEHEAAKEMEKIIGEKK